MIRNRYRILLLLAATVLLNFSAGYSQNAVGFATDFSASNQVVELDVPESFAGKFFFIVWNTPDGQHTRLTLSRKGIHSYDMRQLPDWKGERVSVIATTLPVTARLRTPSLSDEIDMLFEPQFIQPNTINGLTGHSILGWSEQAFGIGVWLLSAIFFAALMKKHRMASLVLGFTVAWGLMDARRILDHVMEVFTFESYRPGMFPLADAGRFVDQASAIIGAGTWGSDPLDDTLFDGYLRYRLAEKAFIPSGSARVPDFWFTQDPKGGQVLLQYANYSLLKKAHP